MDNEKQLSFDFGDTQPVYQEEKEPEIPENFESEIIEDLSPAYEETPVFNEEPPEDIPIENTVQNRELDPADFGDTQPVSFHSADSGFSEDLSSSEDVLYTQDEHSTVPEQIEEPPPIHSFGKTELAKVKKPRKSVDPDSPFKPQNMKRAILGWLLSLKPSGAGICVPTRVSKFCADVAAFWSSPGKKRLMQPTRTVIVEIRRTREQCWPDCSRQEELLPLLIEQKELRRSLETEIRKTEPELKDSDTLFPEYESWRYAESKNRNYRHCLRQIEKIEHALYEGSRFEQIRRAHVADFLYLAVPEGTVNPNELADGWGLINIKSDLSAQLVKEAESWNCPVANRLHLAQNIAASSRDTLFFAFGIRAGKDGKPKFSPIPKRRRNKHSGPTI